MVGELSEDGNWVWDGSKWISKQEYQSGENSISDLGNSRDEIPVEEDEALPKKLEKQLLLLMEAFQAQEFDSVIFLADRVLDVKKEYEAHGWEVAVKQAVAFKGIAKWKTGENSDALKLMREALILEKLSDEPNADMIEDLEYGISMIEEAMGNSNSVMDSNQTDLVIPRNNQIINLDSLTVKDLQDILRRNGRKVSGNKSELIERIKLCGLAENAPDSSRSIVEDDLNPSNGFAAGLAKFVLNNLKLSFLIVMLLISLITID